jgi:hypothetical protein
MLQIRCKNCNEILDSHPTKTKCCGCDNLTSIRGEVITAKDLTKVEIVSNIVKKQTKSLLTRDDLAFQESRKQRKIRKMEFDIR